mgnify:CR=1 FL=1
MPLFAELAERVLAMPPRLGPVRLIAVDGPSGAGKSWFADRLAAAAGAPVVHTDDLLDGWDDQFTFWSRLEKQVLEPLREGRPASYLRYSWELAGFAGEPVIVPPAPAVVLEGVTSARRSVRPELSFSVFVTAPARLRWHRATVRDGGHDVAYQRYLERWHAAEQEHFAADDTAAHADLLVDGAAESPGDQFVPLSAAPPDEPRSAV